MTLMDGGGGTSGEARRGRELMTGAGRDWFGVYGGLLQIEPRVRCSGCRRCGCPVGNGGWFGCGWLMVRLRSADCVRDDGNEPRAYPKRGWRLGVLNSALRSVVWIFFHLRNINIGEKQEIIRNFVAVMVCQHWIFIFSSA